MDHPPPPPYSPDRIIALVGPMGAGKSSVGRVLAGLVGLPFVDLDQAIEHQAGADIPLIFELEGEAGFRARERAALVRELARPPLILACGGGVVLDPDNRACLRRHALVIHLDASVDEQMQRLARDRSRPLLQTPDRRARLEALARERAPLYAEVASLRWHAGGGQPGTVARRLLARLADAPLPASTADTA